MTLFNITDLRASLSKHARLLGVDPGTRTIGLALSDVNLTLASPLASIKRDKLAKIAAYIRELAAREPIGGMVVGLPLSMDGSYGPAAQAAADWARSLADTLEMPFCLWDERLSSSAVNRMLVADADLSRKRRADIVDKLAAAYILQAALDASRPA